MNNQKMEIHREKRVSSIFERQLEKFLVKIELSSKPSKNSNWNVTPLITRRSKRKFVGI